MPSFTELDAITLDQLRATGATKWNRSDGAIGVFTAEMDFGIAPAVMAAIIKEATTGSFGYTPPKYVAAMQSSVQGFLDQRYGWKVPAQRIRPVSDVLAAIEATMRHFMPTDAMVIVPTPAYMPFVAIPETWGRQTIEVPMVRDENQHYTLDLAGIADAFEHGGGLLVMCDPHNPSGRVFSRAELEAVSQLVDKYHGRVFSDEIWGPITFGGRRHIPYASVNEVAAGHTVTAMSASKGWNVPGLKCAQMIVNNDADAERWSQVGSLYEHGASNLGLVANAAAFSQAVPWADSIVAYLENNLRELVGFMHAEMPGVPVTNPEGTYLSWLDFSGYDFGEQSASEYFLAKCGVLMTDGLGCGKVGAGHTRFIAALPRPIMMQALEKLASALNGVPRRA